ncbi:hypothetical protein LMG33818_001019 [Halomonadaceae bacterium LMG 33818]
MIKHQHIFKRAVKFRNTGIRRYYGAALNLPQVKGGDLSS